MAPYKNVSGKNLKFMKIVTCDFSRRLMKNLSLEIEFSQPHLLIFFFYSKSALDKKESEIGHFIKFIDRRIMNL